MHIDNIKDIVKNKKVMGMIAGAFLVVGIVCAFAASAIGDFGQEAIAVGMMEVAKIFIIIFIVVAAIMVLTTDMFDFGKKKDEKKETSE